MTHFGIIVQARFDSSRFPGKASQVLWDDETTIGFLLKRLSVLNKAKNQTLVLATSDTPDCDCLQEVAQAIGVNCLRGDKENVFSRFEHCASEYSFDCIVRVTGDCILHCPELIQSFISKWEAIHAKSSHDFIITNKYPFSYCDGFDIEVFSSELISKYSRLINDTPALQEHVTTQFYQDDRIKKINILDSNPSNFTSVRLVLDYPSDLLTIQLILKAFSQEFPDLSPIEKLSYSNLTSLALFRDWMSNPTNAPNYRYLVSNSTLFV